MASKTTLNAKNLETLGAEKLAALLIEISTGSAAAKRRLRLELAGSESSAEVARAVRKRLSSIERARTIVNWRRIKALKNDLETQRMAISETIAPADPQEALDLLWQFMAVADSVFQRCDDSNGTIMEVFRAACADLGRIAVLAKTTGDLLADRAFGALQDNDYGQYDDVIEALAPALGQQGLERLKAHVVELSKTPVEMPPAGERVTIGWGLNGPIYQDEVYGNHRGHVIQAALEQIADLQGDVDAFIAQKSEAAQKAPGVAADIAGRLLAAGRPEEAWIAIEKVDGRGRTERLFEWEEARIKVMETLGRTAEADRFRLQCFERSLSVDHLKAYVKKLPDFDDMEAEEKAFAFAQAFPDANRALHFFSSWPALAEAAKLVIARPTEFDGNLYELLNPAAEMLQERHPLAATILLRTMIDFTVEHGRSTRYRHAARHLVEADILSRRIDDAGNIPSHQSYLHNLKKRHGKKHGFWSMLPPELAGL